MTRARRATHRLAISLLTVLLPVGLTTISCAGFHNVGCSYAQEGPTPIVTLGTPGTSQKLPLSRSFVVLVPRDAGFGPVTTSSHNVVSLGRPQTAFDKTQYGFVTKYVGTAVLSAAQRVKGKSVVWSAKVVVPCHGAAG